MELTFNHNPDNTTLNPTIDVTMDLLWYSQENMITYCADPSCTVNLTGVPEGELASDHSKSVKFAMGVNFARADRE
jgi:hypothetical protein